MRAKSRLLSRLVFVSAVALGTILPAHAIRIRLWPAGVPPFGGTVSSNEPDADLWRGMKSVILLPVKNEAEGGLALARVAEAEWRENLRESKKFSLEEIHPRSPAAIRAKNENILRDEDIQRWQQQHQLEDAFNLGNILGIQGVSELRISGYEVVDEGKAGKSLKITLAGVLYDMKTRQKEREVISSASVRVPNRNPNAAALEREALREGTRKIVLGFIGRKLPEARKPRPAAPRPAPARQAPAKAAPAKATEANPATPPPGAPKPGSETEAPNFEAK